MITWQIRVRGRVQGVGFRHALRREAERNAVRGWVRNRSDGSVEAMLHGEPDAVARVVRWARRGPAAARVDELEEHEAQTPPDGPYERFEERPSV
jgi:acylphosphatase